MNQPLKKVGAFITEWLTKEGPPPASPLCDFERLRFELRLGDVILMEGRSRVSEVIKIVTQSPWSHSALYIGRIFDIRDPKARALVESSYEGDPEDQLVLEALMGKGTIITPLNHYRHTHLRLCRPEGLAPQDAQKVVGKALLKLGHSYDLRQIMDLARFFFPWGILPRRWRSTLFQHNAGEPTQTVCSTLIAEAFNNVDFPILPFIDRNEDGSLRFFKRNPRLMSPRDFDYSPYFNIIKYPFLGVNDVGLYRRLPWDRNAMFHDDHHPVEQHPHAVAEDPAQQTIESGDLDKAQPALVDQQVRSASITHFPFLSHKRREG